jgi:hypothetical protein
MLLFRHVFIYGGDTATDTHLIGPVISRAIGATAQIVEFVMMPGDIMFLLKKHNPFDGDLRMGLQTLGLPCTLTVVITWRAASLGGPLNAMSTRVTLGLASSTNSSIVLRKMSANIQKVQKAL